MNLNFVLKCDTAELGLLIKIRYKKPSECDRIDFLTERISETRSKIEKGILEEDWGPVREKLFYNANKCTWTQYKSLMSDASMRFSPTANIEERTKFYSRKEKD